MARAEFTSLVRALQSGYTKAFIPSSCRSIVSFNQMNGCENADRTAAPTNVRGTAPGKVK